MAIPQHTIDQILDRTDIVDLIGQRVKLKKSGRTYSGCCPFHQEKSPSFHVYRDKGYFHCFGCQANGNAIRFLMDIDNRSFIDVMKDLSSQTGIELPQDPNAGKKTRYVRKAPVVVKPEQQQTTQPQQQPQTAAESGIETVQNLAGFEPAEFDGSAPSDWTDDAHLFHDPFMAFQQAQNPVELQGDLYDLLENVTHYYQQQLAQSPKAQQYFQQRGLSLDTQQFWRVGYAPEGWQHLEHAFPMDIEGLKQVGLIRSSDSGRDFDLLRDRVIFPIRDTKGRVVGFGGRALNDEIKPKYINSPDSEVFHKNQLLFGLYEGRKLKAQDWMMVEGYMDVIALQQNGVMGAVATLGTASNADHLTTLFKQNPRITLAFDGDAAGQKAAKRTLELALPLLNDGRELKFFVLPPEHDPDSLIRREGLDNFQRLWQQAPLLSDFLFAQLTQQHDISHPEGKSLVMGELKQLTDLLPKQGSFRYLLTQSFRDKLGLGRRFSPNANPDAGLSFNIRNRDEDLVTALLMQHPHLYIHFEALSALIDPQELLARVLAIFNVIFEQLPEDPELACYFVMGACSEYAEPIQQLIQNAEFSGLLQAPEQADHLASDFALRLQEKYLKQKLKAPQSLQESSNLRQQLNQLTKQISLKLLSS